MKIKILNIFLIIFLSLYFSPVVWAEGSHHEHVGHNHGDEPAHKEHTEHEHEEGEHASIHLEDESQNIIGLKIIKAKRMPLLSKINVVGDIAQDTENVKHITAPDTGTLKSMNVHVGDVVEKGTLLAQMTTRDGQDIPIVSPSHGIIMAKYARDGESLNLISSILTIADPDVLRASFNVYEKDLLGVNPGLKVIVKSMAYPEKTFDGEIVFVSPQVDSKTRAIRVRANIKNEEHLLKFGMFVSGEILVPVSDDTIVLPEEALQEVKGKTVIFVPDPKDHHQFQMQEIRVGRRTSGFVEILEGIKENEDVVSVGSYYLKSELLKGELGHGHAH